MKQRLIGTPATDAPRYGLKRLVNRRADAVQKRHNIDLDCCGLLVRPFLLQIVGERHLVPRRRHATALSDRKPIDNVPRGPKVVV
jgi:hypothetical protein